MVLSWSSCQQTLALLGRDFGSLSQSLLCLYQYAPPVGACGAHVLLWDPASAAGTAAVQHRASPISSLWQTLPTQLEYGDALEQS